MKIVLDTNVLVSGLIQPFGPSGQIVRMVAAGDLVLCHDPRVLAEYQEVLLRKKFGFDPERVETCWRRSGQVAFRSQPDLLRSGCPTRMTSPFWRLPWQAEPSASSPGMQGITLPKRAAESRCFRHGRSSSSIERARLCRGTSCGCPPEGGHKSRPYIEPYPSLELSRYYAVRRIATACRLPPSSDASDRITRVTRKIT